MNSEKMQRSISLIKLSEIVKQRAEEIEVLSTFFEKEMPATAKSNLKQALEALRKAVKKIEEVV